MPKTSLENLKDRFCSCFAHGTPINFIVSLPVRQLQNACICNSMSSYLELYPVGVQEQIKVIFSIFLPPCCSKGSHNPLEAEIKQGKELLKIASIPVVLNERIFCQHRTTICIQPLKNILAPFHSKFPLAQGIHEL